jgi:hypothetical protein
VFEDSKLQSLKQHFQTVAYAGHLDAYRSKDSFEPPGSLRIGVRIIEEFVEAGPSATLAGGCPILRRSVPDNGSSL